MERKTGPDRTKTGQFPKGVSGNAAGRPKLDHGAANDAIRVDALPAELQELIATLRTDGWQSSITGIGTALKDKRKSAEFVVEPVSDAEAQAIYRGDDMGAMLVDVIPHHMLREGLDRKSVV